MDSTALAELRKRDAGCKRDKAGLFLLERG